MLKLGAKKCLKRAGYFGTKCQNFSRKNEVFDFKFFLEYPEDLMFASKEVLDFKVSQNMLTGQKCEKKHKIDCFYQIAAQKWSKTSPKNTYVYSYFF